MNEHETGRVAAPAADVYDTFFGPALFEAWPPRLIRAAGVTAGARVLDVACGTGICARAAADVVGPAGTVVGIDINEAMLSVARRRSSAVDWRVGAAEALPFDAAAFDHVLCQFGFMFFADRTRALAEMYRVLRPGGTASIAVWGALDATPGYVAVAALLRDLFGDTVARSIEVPYVLGDPAAFAATFVDAGIERVHIETVPGTARFPSLEAWMYTDIRGWTLAEVIDDDAFAALMREAPRRLAAFVAADGTVEFPAPAHIATFGRE